MKKYRIREGSIADFIIRNKTGLVAIAAAGIILAGMSAATLAFAADEPVEPCNLKAAAENQPEPATEPETAISFAEACEEVNTLTSLGEFRITYYCPCEICCGIWANNRPDGIVYTASGAVAEAGKTIAVDPDVIPYGTVVIIDGHTYTAQDSGSAIQGSRIDIYCDSHEEALHGGVDYFEVFVEGGAEHVQN